MYRHVHPTDRIDAVLGFALVAVAAFVGTLRFGFSETLFAQANGDLADAAAYIGLPLIGYTSLSSTRASLRRCHGDGPK